MAPPAPQKLGFWMTLAMVMGTMIGAGVFLLPASLAPLGWNALYGWFLTIGGAICLAYVLAMLARAFPDSGGPVGYIEHAFGPLVSFLVIWCFLVGVWVGVAALAAAAISYLGMFAPELVAIPGMPALLALALVWIVTLVNVVGTRAAGALQLAALVLKCLPLIAVGLIGVLLFARSEPMATPYVASDISASGIAAAAALCLWAMTGFENAANVHERVRAPERTIPRAIVLGSLATGLIYVGISTAIIAYVPQATLAASDAPFADFIAIHWGAAPAAFIALFAAISALGALNGNVMTQGELPRSMAATGQLPQWLSVCDARGTPVRSLLLSAAIVTALMLLNSSSSARDIFTFMALLSASATLLFYLTCALVALKSLQAGTLPSGIAGIAAVVLGIGYALWAFYGAGLETSAWLVVLLAAGLPLYMLSRARKRALRAS